MPKVNLKVPRSGRSSNHVNLLTSKVGTITPIFVDEVLPASKTSIRQAIKVQLPPLASDTFMALKLKVEAFFVPMRLLCGSFESWFNQRSEPFVSDDNLVDDSTFGELPYFDISVYNSAYAKIEAPGSLADYLGFKRPLTEFVDEDYIQLSAMPFLAYHKIYDDFYRPANVAKSCFARISSMAYSPEFANAHKLKSSPYQFFDSSSYDGEIRMHSEESEIELMPEYLADGVSVFSLRQRMYGFDYFTTALPSPQLGNVQKVTINTSSSTGSFTIPQLRAINAMQQFNEINEIGGARYQDTLHSRYGANLGNGVAQRCLLLGAADYDIQVDGVLNQSASDGQSTAQNPFANQTASRAGTGYALGGDFIVNNFEANEPGYIFIMATLVPKAQYGTGVRRYLTHYIGRESLADMANPVLQQVGMQPIYKWELTGDLTDVSEFAYTDRYMEFMTKESEIHGLFKYGESLSAFAFQRVFDGNANNPEFGTEFLKIDTDDLDDVTAVTQSLSDYGYQMSCLFEYKRSLPLSEFIMPTLQNPAYEHGKNISVHRGGFRL